MKAHGNDQRLQKILGILEFCQKIRSRLSHTIGQGCATGAASFFFFLKYFWSFYSRKKSLKKMYLRWKINTLGSFLVMAIQQNGENCKLYKSYLNFSTLDFLALYPNVVQNPGLKKSTLIWKIWPSTNENFLLLVRFLQNNFFFQMLICT